MNLLHQYAFSSRKTKPIFVRVLPTFALCISFATSCGKNPSDRGDYEPKNVFGTDQRTPADTRQFPYSTIARVDTGCSAFLVGRALAVTAAHCVVDGATGNPLKGIRHVSMDFNREGVAGVHTKVEAVWVGTFQPEQTRNRDWAILKLEAPLGDSRGYLKFQSEPLIEFPQSVSLVGYHTDFRNGKVPAVHEKCSIHKVDDQRRLLHDCDTGAGISGAPLLDHTREGARVLAVAVSEFRQGAPGSVHRDAYSDEYANAAAPADALAEVVDAFINTVDHGLDAPVDLEGVFPVTLPEPDKKAIELIAHHRFYGGSFVDSEAQINCTGPGSNCKGTYQEGARVTLYAPASISSNGYYLRFRYWYCSPASQQFPGSQNLCQNFERQCQVQVSDDLKCAAWYD